MKKEQSFSADNRAGRNLHFGVRARNGRYCERIVLRRFIPFGAIFLVFADYAPDTASGKYYGIQSVFVFTHDSIFVGEDA